MERSKRFEEFKEKYEKEYITKDTLEGWVRLNNKRTGKGITAKEYEMITGEEYKEEVIN